MSETTPTESKTRTLSALEKIDVLRFWAANGVVLVHFLEVFIVRKLGFDDPYGLGTWECWLGWFCVGLFFILSGFVITYSVVTSLDKGRDFDLMDFCKKRIFRIYPVAWGSLVFMLAIYAVMVLLNLHGASTGNLQLPGDVTFYSLYADLKSALYTLFLPPVGYTAGFLNVAMWSLSYEISFYVLFGVLLSLWTRMERSKFIACIGFFTASAFVWNWIAQPFPADAQNIDPITHFLRFFPCWNFLPYFSIWALGAHMYLQFRNRVPMWTTILRYFSIAGILIAIGKLGGSPWNYNQYYKISPVMAEPPYSIFLTVGYTYLLGVLFYFFLHSRWNLPGSKYWSAWGRRYSFTLYATHFGFIYLIFGLLGKRLLAMDTPWWYVVLFFTLAFCTNRFAFLVAPVLESRDLWINVYESVHTKLTRKGSRGKEEETGFPALR